MSVQYNITTVTQTARVAPSVVNKRQCRNNYENVLPLIINVVESISSITQNQQIPQATNDFSFINLIDKKKKKKNQRYS